MIYHLLYQELYSNYYEIFWTCVPYARSAGEFPQALNIAGIFKTYRQFGVYHVKNPREIDAHRTGAPSIEGSSSKASRKPGAKN